MKFLLSLPLACFVWLGTSHAQQITGREWMAQDASVRRGYVLGYVNGIQQMLDHFAMEIRVDAEKPLTSGMIGDELYRKFLAEPELRNGPVNDILFTVFSSRVVVTDKEGKALPAWEKLLTTSQCAEILG